MYPELGGGEGAEAGVIVSVAADIAAEPHGSALAAVCGGGTEVAAVGGMGGISHAAPLADSLIKGGTG